MSDIVPFGKHKGKSVEALLTDREYLDWLLSQGWFQQRYGNLYQIVINNGQEPSETPEHNAMQIKFLDEEYRLKFAFVSLPYALFAFTNNDAVKKCLQEIEDTKASIMAEFDARATERYNEDMAYYTAKIEKNRLERTYCDKCALFDKPFLGKDEWCSFHQEPNKPIKATLTLPEIKAVCRRFDISGLERTNSFIIAPMPVFEKNGVDVEFSIRTGFELLKKGESIEEKLIQTIDRWGNQIVIPIPKTWINCNFKIEIKPSIGDDYPAVLRQIKHNHSNYLLIRSYTGIGATKEQFVEFFDSQGVEVIFEADVDAATLPPFDHKLTIT